MLATPSLSEREVSMSEMRYLLAASCDNVEHAPAEHRAIDAAFRHAANAATPAS
jgi:hypothetical protein